MKTIKSLLLLACATCGIGTAGADNQALKLDAQQQSYVEVPCFQMPKDMTVEAWIKTSQTGTGTIVAWKDVANNGDSGMFRVQNGKLQYGEWFWNAYWTEANSPADVNTGEWTHVAVVRTGTSAILYVNGTAVTTTTMYETGYCTTDNLKIGALGTTWSECFDGELDEVRIWSVARTAEQIAQDLGHELNGDEQGLEGYWRFNGDAYDASGQQRHGTPNNVAYGPSDIFAAEAPEVGALAFSESAASLPHLTAEVSRAGRLYWAIAPAADEAPTARELMACTGFAAAGMVNAGKGSVEMPLETALTPGESYTAYALLSAGADQLSEVKATGAFAYQGLSCLPLGWNARNIGTATGGSATFADGTFTVSGAGTDIWNASDAFHFAYTAAPADLDIRARVTGIDASDEWTKAGIMLRGSHDAASRHVFIAATPGQGNNTFVRLNDGNQTSVATLSPATPWLRLVKKGRLIATFTSADGQEWTPLGTTTELFNGQQYAYVGLAVCGHGSGTATATFTDVSLSAPDPDLDICDRGRYFYKKEYTPSPIPLFSDVRDQLPQPVMDDNPDWVDMYYKAWEIGIGHIKQPQAGSPLVSNFYDEAFDSHIFQWDMLFMTIFGRYADHVFPGVESLDNFYCRQHLSGCITRCLTENTGEDNGDEDSDNIINPPLFSWAEWLNYKFRGDADRLRQVLPALEKYDEFVDLKRRGMDTPHKLYWNNGQASGMDNLPRDIGRENLHHASDHQGWVDMSSQVVMQKECLANICNVLAAQETDAEAKAAYQEKARRHAEEAREIGDLMNQWLWNEERGLYNDVDTLGVKTKWKTIAAFWPLLAGVTNETQDSALVSHLRDESAFWRPNVFPALAADQEGYSPRGGYWCGGVWAPSNYATIKGLERKHINAFAHLASMRYLNAVHDVFEQTRTFWENYAPELTDQNRFNHGTNESDYDPCRRDFIGWTGLAPISLLIENVLGFRADAPARELVYDLRRLDRHGIRGLRFGDITTSVVTEARASSADEPVISVTSSAPYRLIVLRDQVADTLQVEPGTHTFRLKATTDGIQAATALRPQARYLDQSRMLRVDNAGHDVRVDVYSLDCSQVVSRNVAADDAGADIPLDTLQRGVYLVSLTAGSHTDSRKIYIR